jgi:hypothetical protein
MAPADAVTPTPAVKPPKKPVHHRTNANQQGQR